MRNIFIVCSFVLLGIVVMCGPARAMSCCGDTDTQAKAPVFTPIPSASASTVTTVAPGDLSSARSA